MQLSSRRLFVGILFVSIFMMAAREVVDPDVGWHLRTGEYIFTTMSIPHSDIFSFTAAGQPWITHEWLSEVLMYLLYRVGGFGLMTVFFAAMGLLTFVLVFWRSEGRPYVAGFVVLLGAVTVAPFWGARPQTLSLVYTSIFLYILDRYRRVGADRHLLWLLPVFLIWVNSHGSFALGLALISVYLAGGALQNILRWDDTTPRPRRDLGALSGVLLLCVGGVSLNPNGLALYPYPFQTLGSQAIQTLIQEWQPPDFTTLAVQPFLWFLILLAAALVLSRRRIPLVDAILLTGFTLVSLKSARQISIWALIAVPIMSAAVLRLLRALPRKVDIASATGTSRGMQIMNGALLMIFAIAGIVRVALVSDNQTNAERQHFPVDAVNYIVKANVAGPIFNQYDWGGYLIWRLYPHGRVFIDGRSDLYGLTNDLIVREYLSSYTAASDWYEPLQRYGVRSVLVEPAAPLAAQLEQDAAWRQVYADKQAVVFER